VTDTVVVTPAGTSSDDGPVTARSVKAIGTTATVAVTDPGSADEALATLSEELRAIDAACSRFRADSELRAVERNSDGRPVPVSPLLFEALDVACRTAVLTAGTVDPTVGAALIELGYDRDFPEVTDGCSSGGGPVPAPGWWRIELDEDARTVALPSGVHVDVGATAKALVADRAAVRLAEELGCGVLVNLGGDVAVAGPPPPGGWAVGIAPEATVPPDRADQVVAIVAGGLATSGTTARSWIRHGRRVHHIIDPWTGESAPSVWTLVSTTAPSCLEANAWSTAAVVWGEDAIGNLRGLGVSARLVNVRGTVLHTGHWPAVVDDDGTAP
jgi:thiamine biosynthesis lipoprotein